MWPVSSFIGVLHFLQVTEPGSLSGLDKWGRPVACAGAQPRLCAASRHHSPLNPKRDLPSFHRHPIFTHAYWHNHPLIYRQEFMCSFNRERNRPLSAYRLLRPYGSVCVGCPSVYDRCQAVAAQIKRPSRAGRSKTPAKGRASDKLSCSSLKF